MDNYWLSLPNYTQVNLGTWIDPVQGPDFGEQGLLQANYAQSPAMEGGLLNFQNAGVRTMKFPLILASSGAGSMDGINAQLRAVAGMVNPAFGGFGNVGRPAQLTIGLNGVATADQVQFDVYTGRAIPQYDIALQRINRRRVMLELDTAPYGYMATFYLLASVPSVGIPFSGYIQLPVASVIGDVPGLTRLAISPLPQNSLGSGASVYSAGSWLPDFLGWSLGGNFAWENATSGPGWIKPDAFSIRFVGVGGGTGITDTFSPDGRAVQYVNPTTAWTNVLTGVFGGGFQAAGRFRVYAYAKLGASTGVPWLFSVDAAPAGALASGNAVATLAPAVATNDFLFGAQASPAYTLLDLGELTVPYNLGASSPDAGIADARNIRVWAAQGSVGAAAAIPSVDLRFGGMFALPVNNGGIITKGIVTPTISAPALGGGANYDYTVWVDSIYGNNVMSGYGLHATKWDYSTADTTYAQTVNADITRYYRGALPRIDQTTVFLHMLAGWRKAASGCTAPVTHQRSFAKVGVWYRPRFFFVKGV